MKKLLIITLIILFFVPTSFADKRVSVKGYYHKDGTYVRPHYRSAPDGDKSNNYGRASYQQRKQYESLPVIPSYNNDYDSDGVANRYDYDDDNDGVGDNYDSNPYSSRSYSSPSYSSSSYGYDYSSNDDSDDNDGFSGYSFFGDSEEDSDSDSDSSSDWYDW